MHEEQPPSDLRFETLAHVLGQSTECGTSHSRARALLFDCVLSLSGLVA